MFLAGRTWRYHELSFFRVWRQKLLHFVDPHVGLIPRKSFDIFSFLSFVGKLLNFFNSLLSHGEPTFEAVSPLFPSIEIAPQLSSLLKSNNCANNYFSGHNVFAAHDLVLEII